MVLASSYLPLGLCCRETQRQDSGAKWGPVHESGSISTRCSSSWHLTRGPGSLYLLAPSRGLNEDLQFYLRWWLHFSRPLRRCQSKSIHHLPDRGFPLPWAELWLGLAQFFLHGTLRTSLQCSYPPDQQVQPICVN